MKRMDYRVISTGTKGLKRTAEVVVYRLGRNGKRVSTTYHTVQELAGFRTSPRSDMNGEHIR